MAGIHLLNGRRRYVRTWERGDRDLKSLIRLDLSPVGTGLQQKRLVLVVPGNHPGLAPGPGDRVSGQESRYKCLSGSSGNGEPLVRTTPRLFLERITHFLPRLWSLSCEKPSSCAASVEGLLRA